MSEPAVDLQSRLKDEALVGRLPLLHSEREYSTKGILATGFTYAVAAWCFLIGGYAANVVGAVQGIVAVIAGCVIGVTLSAAASALACNRYGLEQIDYTKSCFGQRGAKIILIFYVVNQIGWTGMVLVMFARGVSNVMMNVGLPGGEWIVRGVVLLGIVVCYWIVIRGVHILNVFNAVVTPGLIIATLMLFYVIFRHDGWHQILAKMPLAPASDSKLGYVIAIEYGLGAGFSWWPGIGFLTRNTDTQRNSLYPQIITMGLGMGIVCCTGLLGGLLYRTFDPAEWMMKVAGPILGTIALMLIAIANVSASAMMMYTASLGLRHIRIFRAMSWKTLTACAFIPVLAYAIVPSRLYDNGSAFLAYNATMFAPISGVVFVDYIFLRLQKINISQIFEDDPSGHYWFFGGFNIPALACVVAGQCLYVWLLDPVSLTANGPVRMLTASGPAVGLPMLVYYLLGRFWLLPANKGGFRASTSPILIRKPNI